MSPNGRKPPVALHNVVSQKSPFPPLVFEIIRLNGTNHSPTCRKYLGEGNGLPPCKNGLNLKRGNIMLKAILAVSLLLFSVGASARTLVVQMLGDTTFEGDLPTVWGDVFGSNDGLPGDNSGFNCFSVNLVDPATGMQIGTGIDCLRDLAGDNGPAVTAVSFFILPGGVLVNQGLTSLGLFSTGIGDAGGAVNVMTGSIPTDTTSSLIFGTKKFQTPSGRARVSGAARVGAAGVEALNCLWQIDLENGASGRF